jgi:thioredoxin family protein
MRFPDRRVGSALLLLILAAGFRFAVGQTSSTASFAPLEQWKSAVISGNSSLLKGMYSTAPPTRVMTLSNESNPDAEISFWTGLKARRIKLNVVQSTVPQPGTKQVVFEAEVHSGTAAKDQVVYITEGQLWQNQNGTWKLLVTKRSEASKLEQPTATDKVIYTPGLNAHDEIKQAIATASKEHKNVLVVFGANWCYDCHVLDLAFHRPDVTAVLNRNYEVVHIDVGEGDKNQDIMQQYNVPMKKGIPAIAVLDSHGKLLYSQQGGEFEKARALAPQDVLAFLNKWKPTA